MEKNTSIIWWEEGFMHLPLPIDAFNQNEALEMAKDIIRAKDFEGHFEVIRQYKTGTLQLTGKKFNRGRFLGKDYENLGNPYKITRKAIGSEVLK